MRSNGRDILGALSGMALVIVGILLLVFAALGVSIWRLAWPLVIVVPGLLFFVGMVAGGPKASGLAIPGSIITVTGLLLFYQNAFDQWQSWAYAWSLIFPTAVGLGILIEGVWSKNSRAIQRGQRLVRTGLIIFAAGLIFFELIIGIGGWGLFGSRFRKYVLPLLLIGLGIHLLLRRRSGSDSDTG